MGKTVPGVGVYMLWHVVCNSLRYGLDFPSGLQTQYARNRRATMTPRFFCTEPADEAQFEQERKPIRAEESLDYSTKTDPESPFGKDSAVCEADLFWYPELRG